MKREQSSRAISAAVAGVMLAWALAGCQSGTAQAPTEELASSLTPTATPSLTPTPTPEPALASPDERIEQVRELVANSSLGCTDWRLEPDYPGTTGRCGEEGVLISVSTDLAGRNDVLQRNLDSMEPSPFVVGSDFLINLYYVDVETWPAVAGELGGVVWTSPDPIPTS